MPKTKCTATTANGTPCRSWAMAGTDPPRCAAHGGTVNTIGAPAGNRNAVKHGLYSAPSQPPVSINAVIADLTDKQAALSDYIDRQIHRARDVGSPMSVEILVKLLAIHGQNASRLGRLLRDQRALSGDAADGISGAIAQALDELSTELGVPL